ncbi:Mucin-related protein [Zostera marina]|uniref:Mucin-related protein n=1 Tax=Zostera marina TaxID=29655 RepID=A0A0K9NN94_ZOSMR|nr:Mucin-related protein [Zostera marina]
MQNLRRCFFSVRFLSTTKQHPVAPQSTTPQYGEWNDAWETAWLPEDLSGNKRAPWETDVNFPGDESPVVLPAEADPDTKAFVEEMDEGWDERRKRRDDSDTKKSENRDEDEDENGDYRLRKQRIHASLWMKEIEKNEESRLGLGNGDEPSGDIDVLLDSCSEIFDCNSNPETSTLPSELKNKPDGWENCSSSKGGAGGDGEKNVWEVTQREEDILLQEFERRIAFSKFQIASFIKTHIFSRRRPIDGWKYMIEELGPNARKGKGSVQRMPSLSDPSTQPFKQNNNSRR